MSFEFGEPVSSFKVKVSPGGPEIPYVPSNAPKPDKPISNSTKLKQLDQTEAATSNAAQSVEGDSAAVPQEEHQKTPEQLDKEQTEKRLKDDQSPAEQDGIVQKNEKPGFKEKGFFATMGDYFEDKLESYRNAVDEINMEDYKKQSKWTRFKWAARHPIAWMFGRTKANQRNAEARKKRQMALDSFSFEGIDELQPKIAQESEAASEAEDENSEKEEREEEILKAADSINSGISGGASSIGSILGEFTKTEKGGGHLSAIGAGADMAAAGFNVYKSIKAANEARKAGDGAQLASNITDSITGITGGLGSGADVVNTFLDIDAIGTVTNSISLAKSVVDMGKNSAAIHENRKMKENSAELMTKYAKNPNNKEMLGLMQMVNNTARVNLTKESFGLVANAMSAAGSATSLAGVPVAGTVLGLASSATEKLGDAYAEQRNKNFKREIVNQDLNLDAKIKTYLEKAKEHDKDKSDAEKLNMTPKEAERQILKRAGFSSIEEAYLTIAKRRHGAFQNVGTDQKEEILSAMNLNKDKMTKKGAAAEKLEVKDEDFYQKLGISEEYSKNIDKGIASEREQASKPEFQRIAEEAEKRKAAKEAAAQKKAEEKQKKEAAKEAAAQKRAEEKEKNQAAKKAAREAAQKAKNDRKLQQQQAKEMKRKSKLTAQTGGDITADTNKIDPEILKKVVNVV